MDKDRDRSLKILYDFVKNKNLIKHMLAVEAVMRVYAKRFNEDEGWWGNIGLLHDFDYEKYPDPDQHPYKGAEILKQKGYSQEFIKTILAHASHTNEPRDNMAKKTVFAVDELCGLIVAVALVMPNKKLNEVSIKSIKKKLKDKAFAKQINRNEIILGAQELNMDIDEHIKMTLTALQAISSSISL